MLSDFVCVNPQDREKSQLSDTGERWYKKRLGQFLFPALSLSRLRKFTARFPPDEDFS